ncbi:MAG: hypothetical protein WC484_07040 [Candidatus Omnitrophota bacterium]
MAILRCSKKLLELLSTEKLIASACAGESGFLDEWYAHLFYWNRKKCLLFTEAVSLFSFVKADILKKDLVDIAGLLRKGVAKAMYFEEFPAEAIKHVQSTLKNVRLGIAADRSIRGCMNELIFHWKYAADEYPDKVLDNAPELNHTIAELPMRVSTRHGIFPKERFQELLKPLQAARFLCECRLCAVFVRRY